MSDVSEWGLVACDQTIDQLPPTMQDYGWLVEIVSCERDSDPQGKDKSLLFGCKIQAFESKWDGHVGFVRFFLGGLNPDSAVKRVGRFLSALGIEKGKQVKSTEELVGRLCILGMDVSPKQPAYTRPRQWWTNEADHQKHITNQTLPTWNAKPSVPKEG